MPALGALVCLALLLNRVATGDWRAPALAGAVLVAIGALFAVVRPRDVVPATWQAAPGRGAPRGRRARGWRKTACRAPMCFGME